MKTEILDFRTLIAVMLVCTSLMGQRLTTFPVKKSDTQNLNFIYSPQPDKQDCIVEV
ncbi:MAG: hypothetical protein IPO92_12180 [Saprospiraceae bacterium]|nr:hypothetical protein [Saprospiraceae bacterium]